MTGNASSLVTTGIQQTKQLPDASGQVTASAPTLSTNAASSATTQPELDTTDDTATKPDGEDWAEQSPRTRRKNNIVALVCVILLLIVLVVLCFYLFTPFFKNEKLTSPTVTTSTTRIKANAKTTEITVEPVIDVPQDDDEGNTDHVIDIPSEDGQPSENSATETTITVEAPQQVEVEVEVEAPQAVEVIPPQASQQNTGTANEIIAPETTVDTEQTQNSSKFVPPWLRKHEPAKESESTTIAVPEAVDTPEAKEWPILKVKAVVGAGDKGSALVNDSVISVGEELEEGPTLKSISRQAAVFEWDGETRTIFVSSKTE